MNKKQKAKLIKNGKTVVKAYVKVRQKSQDKNGYVIEDEYNMRRWAMTAFYTVLKTKRFTTTWTEICEIFSKCAKPTAEEVGRIQVDEKEFDRLKKELVKIKTQQPVLNLKKLKRDLKKLYRETQNHGNFYGWDASHRLTCQSLRPILRQLGAKF